MDVCGDAGCPYGMVEQRGVATKLPPESLVQNDGGSDGVGNSSFAACIVGRRSGRLHGWDGLFNSTSRCGKSFTSQQR